MGRTGELYLVPFLTLSCGFEEPRISLNGQMPLYEQQKNRRTGLMFIARGDGLIFYGFHCSLEKHPIISRVSVFLICSPGALLSPRILQETQSKAHSEPVCSK